MDFIPFDCEPLNGNNRIQTRVEQSGGIKKKRPFDDANEVGRQIIFAFAENGDDNLFCRFCYAAFCIFAAYA